MIEIQLNHGQVAIIDDPDLPLVADVRWWASRQGRGTISKWRAYGYQRVVGRAPNGTHQPYIRHAMHRLIVGAQPGQDVDHRNGNTLDNRRSNLRVCTHSDNTLNQPRRPHSSQFKGVSWYPPTGKWMAQINCRHQHHYLGYYLDEVEAARAYDRAAQALMGEFARLNFPAEEVRRR